MSNLKMRQLRGDDVFTVIALLDKLELTEIVQEFLDGKLRDKVLKNAKSKKAGAAESSPENLNVEVGLEVFSLIAKQGVKSIPKAKDDINAFLADLTETDVAAIEKLPIVEYISLIKDFFKHPDLKQLLSSLFQSGSLA